MTRLSVQLLCFGFFLITGALNFVGATEEGKEGKHLFILSGQSNMVRLDHAKHFEPIVSKALGEKKVIVVRDARNGTSISAWFRNEVAGGLYKKLMGKVAEATKGEKIASVTFVWMQGESDSRHPGVAKKYDEIVAGMVKRMKVDLKRKEVNVVIGRINDFGLREDRKEAWPHWKLIREKQKAFVKSYNKKGKASLVNTDDLNESIVIRGETRLDDIHTLPKDFKILGKRFADAALKMLNKVNKTNTTLQAPVLIFDEANFIGKPITLDTKKIYQSTSIPHGLSRKISSLKIKQGYQVTIGVNKDGVGLSKVLIAAKRDIAIPKLSAQFNDSIQFIRVLPWKDVRKKGHGGKDAEGLNEAWYYTWTDKPNDKLDDVQFIPMVHSHYKTKDKSWIDSMSKQKLGYSCVLGFNEPDMAVHKKNEFLGNQKNAVEAMLPLMKTGLRIGGPSCTEQGPAKWYPSFMKQAKAKNLRVDFMGVHWYDWGGMWGANAKKKNNDTPQAIFNRFKKYIEKTHKQYGLPIWITEFNANPKRDTSTQIAFMKLALPYLDSLPYVERYAWFQPFSYKANAGAEDARKMDKTKGNANFRKTKGDSSTPLTEVGKIWKNHASVSTMTTEVYLGKNNLCEDEVETP